MASLYDLELQESNNFIHALIDNGQTPALKLMEDQKSQAASMGETGQSLRSQLEDPNTDLGRSMFRLYEIKSAIESAMQQVGMTTDLAFAANKIFSASPDTLEVLSEEERKTIQDYWLKKKGIIVILLQKGYTHEELFA